MKGTEPADSPSEQTNLLTNGGFESSDLSMYRINQPYVTRQTDTPKEGQYALHFWSANTIDYTVEQTVRLEAGVYQFQLQMQGDKAGDTENIYSYVKIGDQQLKGSTIHLDGYAIWQTSSLKFTVTQATDIVVGLAVTADAGAWGTSDAWKVTKIGDIAPPQTTVPSSSKSGNLGTVTQPSSDSEGGDQPQNTKTSSSSDNSAEEESNQKKTGRILPKLGEEVLPWLTGIGLVLLSLLTVTVAKKHSR